MVGILRAAEAAKKVLSRETRAEISEPNVAFPKSGIASLNVSVGRSEFEDMTEDLVIRTIASVNAALEQAKMTVDQIDGVLLVGGQSRMPMIRSVLEGMFDPKKIIRDGPRAEHAVAEGAAIRAAELDGRLKPTVMQRLVPASIGIRVSGGAYHAFIKRGEKFPIRVERNLRAAFEDQTDLRLIVLQGEDPEARGNVEVCRFDVTVEGADDRVPVMLDVDPGGRLAVWVDGKVVYGAIEEDAA